MKDGLFIDLHDVYNARAVVEVDEGVDEGGGICGRRLKIDCLYLNLIFTELR